MNVFEEIILSMIMLLFPVLCYLFYVVANKNIDEKRRDLVLKFTLISTFYIIQKYQFNLFYNYLLLTIPLFISYKRKYHLVSSVLITIGIVYSFLTDNYYFLLVFINYVGIILFNKEKKYIRWVIIVFVTSLAYILLFNDNIGNNLLYLFAFAAIANLVNYTITKGEDVINYHIEYKDLKKESEIRNSLFKITHEIKNPLAVCKAYIDIFDYDNPECAKKYVPIISGEIEKMLLLLQDFLLVNKDNINFDIMDINVLLEDIVSSMLDLNRFNIELDYIDDEIFINGDYNRLSQVMTNLVKNSFEAHANSVLIKSYVESEDIIVEVIDDGEGLKCDMKRIYEPFYTTKRDGTGLGVALSKEIIEAHSGTLEYFDNYDKGTIAKISLPLQEI